MILLALASSICLFCDALPSLIYLAVVMAWLAFGQFPLVYGGEVLDGEYVWESLSLIFVTLLVFAAVAMIVMDGSRTKKQLEVLEVDDFNLLNNMQEGLFVLNKEHSEIKFGSKTAIRIMGHRQDVLAGCDM